MENQGPSVLQIIAGIAMAVLVIMFGFFIVRTAIDKGQGLTNTINEKMDSAVESQYTQYADRENTGSTVMNVIKDIAAGKENIYVLVKTKANTTGVYYVCGSDNVRLESSAQAALIKNARTKTHNDYITPSEMFFGEINRNSNNAIVGITFTQQ